MEGNLSKAEIDFYRLLIRCESLATEDIQKLKTWRIKAYINTLRNQFNELKKKTSSLNLRECGRRLEDLQTSFLETENMGPAAISPLGSGDEITIPGKLISSALADRETVENETRQKVAAEQEMRHRLLHHINPRSAEAHHGSTGQRHSDSTGDQLSKEEVEKIVEQHRKIQEKQVDQLMGLVRDLKESAKDANTIVRTDNKVLEQANKTAAQNVDDLNRQKSRLDEAVSKSGTLWLWLLIGLVVAAFVGMIVFMKIFHKRS